MKSLQDIEALERESDPELIQPLLPQNEKQASKVKEMQDQVDGLNQNMRVNLESLIERDNKLYNLQENFEELEMKSKIFAVNTRKLKEKELRKYRRQKIALGTFFVCIVLLIILVIWSIFI